VSDPIWRLVTEFDQRGTTVAMFMVCPRCWPTNTEPVGRTPTGRKSVTIIAKTLSGDDECQYCGAHPRVKVSA